MNCCRFGERAVARAAQLPCRAGASMNNRDVAAAASTSESSAALNHVSAAIKTDVVVIGAAQVFCESHHPCDIAFTAIPKASEDQAGVVGAVPRDELFRADDD